MKGDVSWVRFVHVLTECWESCGEVRLQRRGRRGRLQVETVLHAEDGGHLCRAAFSVGVAVAGAGGRRRGRGRGRAVETREEAPRRRRAARRGRLWRRRRRGDGHATAAVSSSWRRKGAASRRHGQWRAFDRAHVRGRGRTCQLPVNLR